MIMVASIIASYEDTIATRGPCHQADLFGAWKSVVFEREKSAGTSRFNEVVLSFEF